MMTNTTLQTSAETMISNELFSKDDIQSKVRACVRPKTDDDVYCIDCADLQMYFRIVFDNNEDGIHSIKITNALIERFNLDPATLRSYAWSNAVDDITCQTMAEALGMPNEFGMPPIYVLSTKSGYEGAGSVLLCTAKLKELAYKIETERLWVLPCSRHELLALPYDFGDRSALDAIIQQVNFSNVDEPDVLSSHAYVFDRSDGSISW